MNFSSVEEDELVIFLLPMPVSLPGGEVGGSASFRKISFSFEAVCSNGYVKGGNLVYFAPGINWPHGLRRTIYIYIYRHARCTSCKCGARSGSPQ